MTHRYDVATAHGTLAVEEAGSGVFPVLLVHGNSSCKEIFAHQMQGPLAERYRFIAFDLPGHGRSSDAPDPDRSYTMPGYAEAAVALLEKLGIVEAAVFGWSLGGHIGIEMIPRIPSLRGLMITGTPPVGLHDVAAGFLPVQHMSLADKNELTEAEIDHFAETSTGGRFAPFMREAVARTDGRAREIMFTAFRAGRGVDQRKTVGTSPVPLAVVNGGDEPYIDLDYIDGVTYANLWEGQCLRLPGLAHAPFWEAPDLFNPIFERFLDSVSRPVG